MNLLTDIPGLRVGHAHDAKVISGVTVVIFDKANVASGVTRGGAPGGRDTMLLEPEMTVESLDAVVLGGGSLFGLDAAGGVVSYLRAQGRGVPVGNVNIPIVTQAIVFDMINGGDKNWAVCRRIGRWAGRPRSVRSAGNSRSAPSAADMAPAP